VPKYSYRCDECTHSFKAFHRIKEKLNDCPLCKAENTLVREINKIFIKKQEVSNSNKKVGELTKQFIEANRDVLKDYKEDLQRKNHNDDENISD
jgi:putative FmdB family regulatory protein